MDIIRMHPQQPTKRTIWTMIVLITLGNVVFWSAVITGLWWLIHTATR